MDVLLVAVTILSLSMTAAMAVALTKIVREERRRSAARVEALMNMASAAEPDDDLPLGGEVPGVAPMFREPEQPSPWPGRAAIAATLAAVALAAIGVASWRGPASAPAAVAGTTGTTATTAAASPLELLSLKHTQNGASLTITGLVQNPRAGQPLEDIAATVFLFAADGTFIGSGRAPLDFTRLAPGDESPFVVTVAAAGDVTRYRVGFRARDGHVIGHVDRRSATTALVSR